MIIRAFSLSFSGIDRPDLCNLLLRNLFLYKMYLHLDFSLRRVVGELRVCMLTNLFVKHDVQSVLILY